MNSNSSKTNPNNTKKYPLAGDYSLEEILALEASIAKGYGEAHRQNLESWDVDTDRIIENWRKDVEYDRRVGALQNAHDHAMRDTGNPARYPSRLDPDEIRLLLQAADNLLTHIHYHKRSEVDWVRKNIVEPNSGT